MTMTLEAIADRDGFIADMVALAREIGDEEARFLAPDARLEDVAIVDDTATAKLVETYDGQETAEPITFRRIDGQWKIAAMPLLEAGKSFARPGSP